MPRMMRPSRFLKEVPEEFLESFHLTAAPREREDIVYDEEEKPFEIGDSVHHRDFGTGIVQKIYNTSLGLTYDVFFPKANSIRSLVAKFAKLKPVH
jgi:DNA helicase II / ATP-dependent DNA helicase PcrA